MNTHVHELTQPLSLSLSHTHTHTLYTLCPRRSSANPFAGWSGSSSSSPSSSGSTGYSGAPFDVDAFWNEFRPNEETTKDINDSFGSIFDDLFGGVKDKAKSRKRAGGGSRESILDDFGDFLETILETDGMSECVCVWRGGRVRV